MIGVLNLILTHKLRISRLWKTVYISSSPTMNLGLATYSEQSAVNRVFNSNNECLETKQKPIKKIFLNVLVVETILAASTNPC